LAFNQKRASSILKFCRRKRSDDAFSEIFFLEASPVESQKLLQKDKKMRRMKSEKKLVIFLSKI